MWHRCFWALMPLVLAGARRATACSVSSRLRRELSHAQTPKPSSSPAARAGGARGFLSVGGTVWVHKSPIRVPDKRRLREGMLAQLAELLV